MCCSCDLGRADLCLVRMNVEAKKEAISAFSPPIGAGEKAEMAF